MQFDITGSAKRIEARTSERLSFDNPKHNAYRWELAARIATLAVGKGEVLHASYCGPDDPGRDRFDVENVLFYNVRLPRNSGGSCFSRAAGNGISFAYTQQRERRTVYEVVLIGTLVERQPMLIDYGDIPVCAVNSDTKPWQVWQSFHLWLDQHPTECVDWPGRHFGMEIGVGGVAGNFAAYVKPVFDGVIAAFHSATAVAPEIAGRIAGQVHRNEETVFRWLKRREPIRISDEPPVYLRGAGVQWSPADHLCSHGVLRPIPTGSRTMRLRVWSTEAR